MKDKAVKNINVIPSEGRSPESRNLTELNRGRKKESTISYPLEKNRARVHTGFFSDIWYNGTPLSYDLS